MRHFVQVLELTEFGESHIVSIGAVQGENGAAFLLFPGTQESANKDRKKEGTDVTQQAVVLEQRGKNALVSVERSSMCEGCEKKGSCGTSCLAGDLLGANKTMTALARNDAGAKSGDRVEIESSSATVLGYAALIFLFPLLVCALGYGVGVRLGLKEEGSFLLAGAGFALSFLLIFAADRKKRKSDPEIVITRVLVPKVPSDEREP